MITANRYESNHDFKWRHLSFEHNVGFYISIPNIVTAIGNCNPAPLSKVSKRVERNSGSDKLV